MSDKTKNADLRFLHTMALAHQTHMMMMHFFEQMRPGNLRLKMLTAANACNDVSKKFLQEQREKGIMTLPEMERISLGIGTYLAICEKSPLAAGVIADLANEVFDGNVDTAVLEAVLEEAKKRKEAKDDV